MRHILQILCLTLFISNTHANPSNLMSFTGDKLNVSLVALQQKHWIHGSKKCSENTDPAIDVYRYDSSSYILRQNKCLNFEAPFIYLLIGDEKVIVLDTGATGSAQQFPLYETVRQLISEQSKHDGKLQKNILVIHSHSHKDHYSGDVQFEGKPGVTLVKPKRTEITRFFSFKKWPLDSTKIDLGGRVVTIIPTPGHQEEAISIYDSHTKWLLTGDTFYPGNIFVKHWDEYKKSIARLVSFSHTHSVSAVLGAHIEMTKKPREYYPIGSVYQPEEASLILFTEDLIALNTELIKADKKQTIKMEKLIVTPMNGFQKTISNIARWILQ